MVIFGVGEIIGSNLMGKMVDSKGSKFGVWVILSLIIITTIITLVYV